MDEVLGACSALGLESLPENVETFVRQTFVLPTHHDDTGVRVDFIFSTTQFERQAIERAVTVNLSGTAVPFAAAEDLIIHKLFAGRAVDLEDAAAVSRRKRRELDWEYVEYWVREFAAIPGRENLPHLLANLRSQIEDREG